MEIVLEIQWFGCSAVIWRHYIQTIESPIRSSNTLHNVIMLLQQVKLNNKIDIITENYERDSYSWE